MKKSDSQERLIEKIKQGKTPENQEIENDIQFRKKLINTLLNPKTKISDANRICNFIETCQNYIQVFREEIICTLVQSKIVEQSTPIQNRIKFIIEQLGDISEAVNKKINLLVNSKYQPEVIFQETCQINLDEFGFDERKNLIQHILRAEVPEKFVQYVCGEMENCEKFNEFRNEIILIIKENIFKKLSPEERKRIIFIMQNYDEIQEPIVQHIIDYYRKNNLIGKQNGQMSDEEKNLKIFVGNSPELTRIITKKINEDDDGDEDGEIDLTISSEDLDLLGEEARTTEKPEEFEIDPEFEKTCANLGIEVNSDIVEEKEFNVVKKIIEKMWNKLGQQASLKINSNDSIMKISRALLACERAIPKAKNLIIFLEIKDGQMKVSDVRRSHQEQKSIKIIVDDQDITALEDELSGIQKKEEEKCLNTGEISAVESCLDGFLTQEIIYCDFSADKSTDTQVFKNLLSSLKKENLSNSKKLLEITEEKISRMLFENHIPTTKFSGHNIEVTIDKKTRSIRIKYFSPYNRERIIFDKTVFIAKDKIKDNIEG